MVKFVLKQVANVLFWCQDYYEGAIIMGLISKM